MQGPVPPPGSIRSPSRRLVLSATVVGVLLAGCVGYQVLWGGGLPADYCLGVSTLSDTLQRAADGTISDEELASKLSEVSDDFGRAGTIDPAQAGTEVPAQIAKLQRSVYKAMTAAQTGLGVSLALDEVRRDLAQVPHC